MTNTTTEMVHFYVYDVPRYSYFSIVFDDPDAGSRHSMIFDAMLEGNIFDANRGLYYDAIRVDGNSFSDTKIDVNETGFYDFETSRNFFNGRKKDF